MILSKIVLKNLSSNQLLECTILHHFKESFELTSFIHGLTCFVSKMRGIGSTINGVKMIIIKCLRWWNQQRKVRHRVIVTDDYCLYVWWWILALENNSNCKFQISFHVLNGSDEKRRMALITSLTDLSGGGGGRGEGKGGGGRSRIFFLGWEIEREK